MPLIPAVVESIFNRLLDKVAAVITGSFITPNFISTIGLLPSLLAAIALMWGQFVTAGFLILLGGTLDMIDGKVARRAGTASPFGAIYDATLDRAAEIAMYTGLGAYCVQRDLHLTTLFIVVAAGGSILVSYVRARAESYGIPCNVGVLRRGERIVLLGGGALLAFVEQPFHVFFQSVIHWISPEVSYPYPPMPITISIVSIAVLSLVTVGQRLHHFHRMSVSKTQSDMISRKDNQ